MLSGVEVAGVTGFRLEALKDPSLPFGGPGRQATNGNHHLSEFVVSTVPEPQSALMLAIGLGAAVAGQRLFTRRSGRLSATRTSSAAPAPT